MRWLVCGLTWGLPFLILKRVEDPWNEPKELLWLAGCWGLILLGLFRSSLTLAPWRQRSLALLGGWVFLLGLAHFYWPFLTRLPNASRIAYNVHHWIPTIYVLTAFLTVRVMATWLSTEVTLAWVIRWLCLSSLAVALYAIAQGLGLDEFYRADYIVASPSKPMGVAFGNAGTTAMYLALTLPLFFLLQGWRWVLAGAVCLAVILYLPYRSSWVVAASGLLTYGFCRLWHRPWKRPLARVSLVLLVLLSLAGGAWAITPTLRQDERWPIWQETLHQWQAAKRPWTGYGLQSFPDRFVNQYATLRPPAQTATRWFTPFNEWLQALYELGLIGCCLLAGVTISLLRTGWRQAQIPLGAGWLACGVACLTCSLLFFPWHYAPTSWVTMLAVASLTRSHPGGLT